mgnify:CR=1 FL=1
MKITDLPADHSARKSKTCRTCGEFKSPKEFQFWKQKNSYGGYQSSTACKSCEKLRKLKSLLKHKYNLGWDEYLQMVDDQDNKCLLCGSPPDNAHGRLVVDHCHYTGKVRGLLCIGCNLYLSKIEACPDYLQKVLDYLNA